MGEIVFIGLGLHDESGISMRGLEELKNADEIFIETYTSLLPRFSKRRLEHTVGRRFRTVSRKDLEEQNGKLILNAAEKSRVVLLVPGDPLIATTHVTLRIEAEKRAIKTCVVHAASIISAAIGLSGLHNYKFGKSVTIPFPDETPAETPYKVIAQNKEMGLHTLCLLDINVDQKRFLTINDALLTLLSIERKLKKSVSFSKALAVGIARAGSRTPLVKADSVERLQKHDFGGPPFTLVFPGKLHFMEAEALILFAGAPETVKEMVE